MFCARLSLSADFLPNKFLEIFTICNKICSKRLCYRVIFLLDKKSANNFK